MNIATQKNFIALQTFRDWWMLRRIGFFSNQMGIINRYLREQDHWEPHLTNTRRVILEAIDDRLPKTVTVLGSGWLLDIPLLEMIQRGIEVKLIDVAHPPRVRHKYKDYPKVRLIDADITSCIREAWLFGRQSVDDGYHQLLTAIGQPNLYYALNVDLVLSVNILTQLHALIVDYLANRGRIDKVRQGELTAAIQQAHLNALPAGRTLLIADLEEEHYNDSNVLLGVNPRVVANFDGWKREESWQWKFDTKRMFSGDQQVILNVSSFWKK
ncbi:MAG TPA: hypothetical protein PKL52_06305 [Tenuifilaceae bacterium]|nr:hypothetical protein [Tenuifilaceae bacterium]